MAKIEMPLGLAGSADLPRTLQGLRNCFNNQEGLIIGRDGITSKGTTEGFARGSFLFEGSLYAVTGTKLIKYTDVSTGAYTIIGDIAGSDHVRVAVDFSGAAIVVKNGAIYTLSPSDVLVDVSANPNFVACVDVAVIDGIFVYIPADGSPAFFSDVGAAGTVQGTSFFDAESLPDKNKAVIAIRGTLLILGENSIEPFRNLGTPVNPFGRVQGGRVDYGYLGGLLEYADTFVFIGRKKGQGPGIYAFQQGAAQKLSNERIDTLLKTYTETELDEAIAARVEWKGYDIATFSLREDSFGLYRQQFFPLDAVREGVSRPWGGGFIIQYQLKYYSFFQGNFGLFEGVNTDYGDPLTRTIDLVVNEPDGKRFTCSRVELGISQGLNPAVGSVALFMSKDNESFPIPVYRNLGDLGDYQDRLVWEPPGGLGSYLGFMGIRIFTTEDVKFSADSLSIEINQ
jgi:hypothetical protein